MNAKLVRSLAEIDGWMDIATLELVLNVALAVDIDEAYRLLCFRLARVADENRVPCS